MKRDTKMFESQLVAQRFYNKLLVNPAVVSVYAPKEFRYTTTLGEELVYWEVNYILGEV